MRLRAIVPLAVAAAAGCSALTESPTAPAASPGAARFFTESPPPPPPVDTGVVVALADASYSGGVRYFANRPGTIAWVSFGAGTLGAATPNARLQYNIVTGETRGTGLLTLVGPAGAQTLDLSLVTLGGTAGGNPFACAVATRGCVVPFSTSGGAGGSLTLIAPDGRDPVIDEPPG
jgi:hypothetical protein